MREHEEGVAHTGGFHMNSDKIKQEAEALLLATEDEHVEAQCLQTLAICELNTTMVFFKEAYRNNIKRDRDERARL